MKRFLIIAFVIVLSLIPISAFASEDAKASSEAPSFELVIPEEYLDPVYDKLASDGSGSKAQKTIDDIYQQLSSVLSYQYYTNLGESYNNTYSLPRIASYTNRIAQTLYGSGQAVPATSLYSRVTSLYNAVNEIHFILNGDDTGTVFVRPDIQSALFSTDGQGNFTTISDILYEYQPLIYSMLAQVHGDGQNTSYYLSNLSSSVSSIESKLFPTWANSNASYFGASQTAGGSYVSSGWYSDLFFSFIIPANTASSSPSLFRIFVPIASSGSNLSSANVDIKSIKIWNNNTLINTSSDLDYYFEPTSNGIYIYLFGARFIYPSGTYFLELSSVDNATYYYNSSYPLAISSIPFDSDFYQQIKQAYASWEIAQSVNSVSDDLSAIRDVVASPDLVSAKEAQQDVETQVLDDFTGNGTESIKLSDVGGVKSVSSNVKSFVSTGARLSDFLGVFNVNGSGIWVWFSQTTADNLDTSPALRSNEFISIYDLNMQQYLNSLGDYNAESR